MKHSMFLLLYLQSIVCNTINSCGYFTIFYFGIDDQRIQDIGPDIACAEWLMKNGAQIRWKGCSGYVCHYNCIPHNMCKSHENRQQFQIEQVFAGQDACISDVGFRYFKDCNAISNIAFVGCQTINNEALRKLETLSGTLSSLVINGCNNVSDDGLLALGHIWSLNRLNLKNLQLKNEPNTINELKAKLPHCNISYENDEN